MREAIVVAIGVLLLMGMILVCCDRLETRNHELRMKAIEKGCIVTV